MQVDTLDTGCSDHFSVWMEFGRACKLTKSHKENNYEVAFDRFVVDVRCYY